MGTAKKTPATGTPPRRTQEERKAESERAIVRAARELFARQGYLRTTLAEVGKAAGYTGGLVSHRFGSKEGLLRAVLDRSTRRFNEDQLAPALDRASGEEALRRFIEIYLKEVSVRESRVRALYVIMGEALGAVPEIQSEIAKLNRGFRNQLAGLIRRGVDAGEFDADIDVDDAAVLVLGLLRGVTMQYLADPRGVPLSRSIPMVQTAALNALR